MLCRELRLEEQGAAVNVLITYLELGWQFLPVYSVFSALAFTGVCWS